MPLLSRGGNYSALVLLVSDHSIGIPYVRLLHHPITLVRCFSSVSWLRVLLGSRLAGFWFQWDGLKFHPLRHNPGSGAALRRCAWFAVDTCVSLPFPRPRCCLQTLGNEPPICTLLLEIRIVSFPSTFPLLVLPLVVRNSTRCIRTPSTTNIFPLGVATSTILRRLHTLSNTHVLILQCLSYVPLLDPNCLQNPHQHIFQGLFRCEVTSLFLFPSC